MRVDLTDRFVATTKPADGKRVEFFDAATTGLSLRVWDAGGKVRRVWAVTFTSPRDQKRARLTLGSYPATSLAKARTRALQARGYLEENPPRDPRDVMREEEAGAMTVADLVPLYVQKPHKRTGKPRKSADEIKRRLDVNVVPIVGSVKLAELHKRDMQRVTKPVLDRGRPVEATRVFEDFRAMVRWGVGQGYLDANPFEGMEKPGRAADRDRVLDEDEIRAFWAGLPKAMARSKACQRILKLCLVTGQRVGEVAGIAKSEINTKAKTWTIPAARSKNGHAHVVPLSEQALKLVEEAKADSGEAAWLFLNEEGDGPLPPRVVARTLGRALEETDEQPLGRLGIAHFAPHDLRRTVVSQMAAMQVAPIVLAHVVNHVSATKAGVTLGVYNTYSYEAEKRKALELWADRLDGLVGGRVAEVVPLGQKKSQSA